MLSKVIVMLMLSRTRAHTHTHTHTHLYTDAQTDIQADRQTDRQTDEGTYLEVSADVLPCHWVHTSRQTDIPTDRWRHSSESTWRFGRVAWVHKARQTDSQTDRNADRQTDKWRNIPRSQSGDSPLLLGARSPGTWRGVPADPASSTSPRLSPSCRHRVFRVKGNNGSLTLIPDP